MTPDRLLPLAALALLAACATPPDHFHTLRPPTASPPSEARAAPRLLSIGPVTVPDALARDEWVIRQGATGARVYDHQLWTQGLGADIAQSLADYINLSLPPDELWADAGPTGSGSGADLERPAPLRLRVQVLRFDSMLEPDLAVEDQVRWTLECLPPDGAKGLLEGGRYRVLRTAVTAAGAAAPPADPGVEASQRRFDRLARAHSGTVQRVAAEVATALRATAAERAKACRTGP
jgi:uncharacterized protein